MAKTATKYFFKGLAVVLPIAILFYIIDAVASLLGRLLPFVSFPVALAATIIAIVLVGAAISSTFARRGRGLLVRVLKKIPPFYHVYRSFESSIGSLTQREAAFEHPVWVIDPTDSQRRIGFVTKEDMNDLELPGHVAVYMPDAFSLSGVTAVVSKEQVRDVAMDRTQAFTFAVSGGAAAGTREATDADPLPDKQ